MSREGDPLRPAPLPEWMIRTSRWKPRAIKSLGLRAKAAAALALSGAADEEIIIDNLDWKTHTRGVRLWKWLWEEIERGALESGASPDSLIRNILWEWIKACGESGKAHPRHAKR